MYDNPITSIEQFKIIIDQVTEEMNIDGNVFATSDYLTLCALSLGKKRNLYTFANVIDSNISYVAPLTIEREIFWNRLRSLSSGHSDYEATLLTSKVRHEASNKNFIKSLISNKDWDCLTYWGVPEQSPFIESIRTLGLRDIYFTRSKKAPYLDLSVGYDALWNSVPNRVRSDTRRCLRKLKKMGEVKFKKLVPSQNASNDLEKFFDMHCLRRAEANTVSMFEDIKTRSFFSYLLNNNDLVDFRALYLNDEIIAFHLGFSYLNKYFYYIPTFDSKYASYSVGRILLTQLIENCCNNGIEIFDFMVGEEGYKLEWPVSIMQTYDITIYNRTLGGKTAKLFHENAKPLIKKISELTNSLAIKR